MLRLIMVGFLILLLLLAGCGNHGQNPMAPQSASLVDTLASDTTGVVGKPGAWPAAISWPNWYRELPVAWLPQLPPGTNWALTKNCGQTCALMCDGYFRGYRPTSNHIVEADWWLNGRFPGVGFAPPYSYYTNFVGRNALGTLLREKYGLKYYVNSASYNQELDLSNVLWNIEWGHPVICAVRISGGNIVTSGGVEHWTLVVGYDRNYGGQVILNDPGTNSGNKKRVNVGTFLQSWSSVWMGSKNRIWVPVWK